MNKQSLGGKLTAAKLQARANQARIEYNNHPNVCHACNNPIIAPIGCSGAIFQQIKRKKFCNHSCAATINNKKYQKRERVTTRHCQTCGKQLHRSKDSNFCRIHANQSRLHVKTKGEIFKSCKNWQSARSIICKHATKAYLKSSKPKQCLVCGYKDIRVLEVAHRTPVSDFSNNISIAIINNTSNLEMLCPTHHVEIDKGIRDW